MFFSYYFSGKLARLPTLSSSQSVSFRHGTNVEFNNPGFPGSGGVTAGSSSGGDVPPLEGYNLQTVNTNKTRDFSNPMYDAVQSGTTTDPNLSNGSGKFEMSWSGVVGVGRREKITLMDFIYRNLRSTT